MKQIGIVGVIVFVLLALGVAISNATQSDSPVVAQNGMHWHPRLEIFVRGEKVDIPMNMGLGAVHKPIHTHEDLPILHLEFDGTVREEDIMLGKFFKNWGKDMRSFGSAMHMRVNGMENTEYERYIMKDGDVIELHYD